MQYFGKRVRNRVSRLSLRQRLGLSFSVLMFFAVCFTVLLVLRQHRVSLYGATWTVRAYETMARALHLRESLAEIDRQATSGIYPEGEILRFRRLISGLKVNDFQEFSPAVEKIETQFSKYLSLLGTGGPIKSQAFDLKRKYEDVAVAVGAYLDKNESFMYSLAETLKGQQARSVQFTLFLFSAFMVIFLMVSYRMISVITYPISQLAKFLDDLNIEGQLLDELPHVDNEVAEVRWVAKSFERLLHRLKGYQVLNVSRLLIEKRRAEIIAESISEGIFLLKGKEVLYMNSTAERILSNAGIETVLKAVDSTMPVEFNFTIEGRKYCYLLQSQFLSNALIERVEHAVSDVSALQLLDRFQANTLVLAQDVTIVKESQEAKNHFLATLSHEVKTPVTSLTMATRLLRRSVDQIENPSHRSLIVTCSDDVDRLRKLLDDLLRTSHFDTFTQRLEIQTVDLGKLLTHSIQTFQPQAIEREIRLTLQVQAPSKKVLLPIDATKITWAVSNLVLNALRHTPRGGVVDISLTAFEDRVELKVKDTGPGIERHRQDRIFDKFSSYYNLRVARSGSVGVGLAIAKEIIVAHGGRIWVSSEVGHGAEFGFRLPVTQPTQAFNTEVSRSRIVNEMSEHKSEKNRFIL